MFLFNPSYKGALHIRLKNVWPFRRTRTRELPNVGLAFILDRKNYTYRMYDFKNGQGKLILESQTYDLDSDYYIFFNTWKKIIRWLPSFIPLFRPSKIPYLYFEKGNSKPLDIVDIYEAQKYKLMNPVLMKITVQQQLESKYFKGLITVGGRKQFRLRYLILIFAVVAVGILVLRQLGYIKI